MIYRVSFPGPVNITHRNLIELATFPGYEALRSYDAEVSGLGGGDRDHGVNTLDVGYRQHQGRGLEGKIVPVHAGRGQGQGKPTKLVGDV